MVNPVFTMQAVKSQQSSIDRQTSFAQKGLQHLNSKVIASQLGEGADQGAAVAELSSLQESIHIIAHVAHAVAVNQLDMPQARIQVPSTLTLSSSQSSSERQAADAATAPLDLPQLGLESQTAFSNAGSVRVVDQDLASSPSRRGSFKSPRTAEPTSPTNLQNGLSAVPQSSAQTVVSHDSPDNPNASSLPSAKEGQPQSVAKSEGHLQVEEFSGESSSMRGVITTKTQATEHAANRFVSGTAIDVGAASMRSPERRSASVIELQKVLSISCGSCSEICRCLVKRMVSHNIMHVWSNVQAMKGAPFKQMTSTSFVDDNQSC